MASLRLALSILALVGALGGAAALAVWAIPEAGATDAFRVEVRGSDGILLDETVSLSEATVLLALQEACARRDLDLELERYPGMGTYVRAIAGERAQGAEGWVYEVLREGAWINGDRSAEFFPLDAGDEVRWSWV